MGCPLDVAETFPKSTTQRHSLRGFCVTEEFAFSARERMTILGNATAGYYTSYYSPIPGQKGACPKQKKRNGSSGRTRTYNPPVNSRVQIITAIVNGRT